MKTLNEVIENLGDGIEHLCAMLISKETWGDALHYLMEYREKHDDILRMEEALGYCEIMDNPPLDWEQLKTMEGKPVWVEINGYNGYWTIVHWNSNIVFEEYYDWIASPEDPMKAPLVSLDDTNFGKTWQAYRKERK